MNVPMREKYVDARVGIWFIFGQSDGAADISDGTDDVFTSLPIDVADRVIAAHDEFRGKLYEILCGKNSEPQAGDGRPY